MSTEATFTEAEAAKRECPQKLVHPGIPASRCACLGPRCMAWRWFQPSIPLAEAKGFCGLAGLPDGVRR